jgi:hypothetical protein
MAGIIVREGLISERCARNVGAKWPGPSFTLLKKGTMRNPQGYYPIPEWGEGVSFASVTTIQSVLRKYQLEQWQVDTDVDFLYENGPGPLLRGEISIEQFHEIDWPKLVADAKRYHKEVSGAAKDFGSRIHAALDAWHKDGARPSEPDLIEPFARILEWEESVFFKPIESEAMVYSETYRYAGTMDVLAEIRLPKWDAPLVGVFDYKSRGSNKKGRIQTYPADKQQIGAYVYAWEEMAGKILDFGGVGLIDRDTGAFTPRIYMRPELIQPTAEFIALASYFNIARRGK